MGEAERLKRSFGCAVGRMVPEDEEIEVPGVGGHAPRRVPRRVMSDIIEPRVEEIFSEVRARLEASGLIDSLASGVVLTGGAVLMEGMVEAAEEILAMPVRLGFPIGVRGIVQLVQGPQYAAGVGLVGYGAQRLSEAQLHEDSGITMLPGGVEEYEERPNRAGGFLRWLKEAL